MTKRDAVMKWLTYGGTLLLVCLLQLFVTDRISIFGVHPMLLPLCAVTVGILEGPSAGAGFGLATGLLSLVAIYRMPVLILLFLPLAGLLSGLVSEYVIQSRFLGSLLCSMICLVCIEGYHIIPRLVAGVPIRPLLQIALPELLYSLLCLVPVYFLFHLAHRRVSRLYR
ncbi:MAG: rod shape-determining protein MreD [Oscillospiraceae bacterium]|jgi:hypothetical protein